MSSVAFIVVGTVFGVLAGLSLPPFPQHSTPASQHPMRDASTDQRPLIVHSVVHYGLTFGPAPDGTLDFWSSADGSIQVATTYSAAGTELSRVKSTFRLAPCPPSKKQCTTMPDAQLAVTTQLELAPISREWTSRTVESVCGAFLSCAVAVHDQTASAFFPPPYFQSLLSGPHLFKMAKEIRVHGLPAIPLVTPDQQTVAWIAPGTDELLQGLVAGYSPGVSQVEGFTWEVETKLNARDLDLTVPKGYLATARPFQ